MLQSEVSDSFFLFGLNVIDEIQIFLAEDELVEVDVDSPGCDILVKVDVIVGGLKL